jgi:hypothetical protein
VEQRLVELALGHRPDVGARGEHLIGAGDDDAANFGIGVVLGDRAAEQRHQLGRQRVARFGAVEAKERDVRLDAGLEGVRGHPWGVIASTPVRARPMISFWICDVPSYSVVTLASRR